MDAVLQVRPLELDELIDERRVVRHSGGVEDGGHVALHAAVCPDASRGTGPFERLLEPVRLHVVADASRDGVAQPEPLAPHDRVVEVEQDGVVRLGHAA